MRINFDFHDLEAFLAVKETGSFHLASERLGLSQSSVSRRIHKLEEALGSLLFERTTRDVRPTLAAKRLQIRAETMLQDAQETSRAMRDESAAYAFQRAQTITVATIPTVVPGLLTHAVCKFQTRGNKARIRILDLAANEVAEAVANGEADFGISSIPMLEPATEFERLFDDPIVLAMPSDHALARRGSLSWQDLKGEALILPARGTGNRLLIDEALARSPNPLHWQYEVGRSTTALDLVSKGIGVAPLPKMALVDRPSDSICWRPVNSPDVSRPVGLLSRIAQTDLPVVGKLKEELTETVGSLLETAHD
ncbi:MAG: LysR family transcriptional regulator [Pseudomonadota bacterium]